MQALAERHDEFGILQIDAHMDLRDSYEGFRYSHASAMHNALQLESVQRLVQVGIRDFSQQEFARLETEQDRLQAFTMRKLRQGQFRGETWAEQTDRSIAALPDKVYLSFDIDGLDPGCRPATGTPVPDGLRFEEAMYLLEQLQSSGRTIIGADLVEVAPGEIDSIVGARVLYRLCGLI